MALILGGVALAMFVVIFFVVWHAESPVADEPGYIVVERLDGTVRTYSRLEYVDTIQRAVVADFYGACTYGTQVNAEVIYFITHGNDRVTPRDLTLSERRIAGLVWAICEHAAAYAGAPGFGPVLPVDGRPAAPFPVDPYPDPFFLDPAFGVAVGVD